MVGIGLCFYGFLIKSHYFGPYLVFTLQSQGFKWSQSWMEDGLTVSSNSAGSVNAVDT